MVDAFRCSDEWFGSDGVPGDGGYLRQSLFLLDFYLDMDETFFKELYGGFDGLYEFYNVH